VNSGKARIGKVSKEAANSVFGDLGFRWACATDIGRLRREKQDSFLVVPEIGLFLVSDGMGGHRAGALASRIVAENLPVMIKNKLAELKAPKLAAIRNLIRQVIIEQNRQLRMEGNNNSDCKGMGATLALLLIYWGRCFIANIGDSRVYRLGQGRFIQLTRDHSVAAELLSEGKITPQQAQNHAGAHQLTGYVGMEEKPVPYVRSFALNKGDRFLMCTDGLTGMICDVDISKILQSQPEPQGACGALVAAANAAGGEDNITVIVVDWLGRD